MNADQDLRSTVDALMDGLRADLERLARIPSIAFPGFPPEPVRQAHDLVVELLRDAGVERIERLDLPETAPVVYAEILLHALATLHDADGNVAVAGLRREAWSGTSYTDEEFRDLAAVRDGVPLIGSGSLGERLWSGPAATVIGVDAPTVDHAASALVPYARAKLNLRFHPQQDPKEAQGALVAHLEALRPFGIPLTVTPGDAGPGFESATGGPAYRAALTALREGWGAEPAFAASGGSIPLVNGLAKAAPGAEVLLFGAQDSMCALHAPNERVLLSELRGAVIAEAAFGGES